MATGGEIKSLLARTESYLVEQLLPFWMERAPDPEAGGFLTYFDRDGRPTGETDKTFLMQIRTLYTMASAHRAGYGGERSAALARLGADFILEHYWDDEHGGWIWIADRYGKPLVESKIGYGQCFAMYAFSEYYLATGDVRGRLAAERRCIAPARLCGQRHGRFARGVCHSFRGRDTHRVRRQSLHRLERSPGVDQQRRYRFAPRRSSPAG